jgi:hypothetical protein
VLPMVRVDRLYLGPMFAPDQLGRDKMCLSLKLGRELLPVPVYTGPFCPFLRLCLFPIACCCSQSEEITRSHQNNSIQPEKLE